MVSTMMDITHVTVNVLRDDKLGHNKNCRILEIVEASGDRIMLHFNNPDDLRAFKGVVSLAGEGE